MILNDELDAAIARLIAHYNQRMAAGSILRCFAKSVHELRAAGVEAGLAIAAEAMTRRRLDSRLSLSGSLA
jgi:hypothetical protein